MNYSIEISPWDITELGTEALIEEILRLGVNQLRFTASWPGSAVVRSRSRAGRVHFPERGAIYFKPSDSVWTDRALRPHMAELVLIEDFLNNLVLATRAASLQLEARFEFLPYVPSTNTVRRASNLSPKPFSVEHLFVQNAFGDRLPGFLCPTREEVREYFVDLIRDATRYEMNSVMISNYGFPLFNFMRMPGAEALAATELAPFLLSLCFCDACKARAAEMGVETEPLSWRVRNYLTEIFSGEGSSVQSTKLNMESLMEIDPSIEVYLKTREESVVEFVRALRELLGERLKLTSALGGVAPSSRAWLEGMDVAGIAALADELYVSSRGLSSDELNADIDAIIAMGSENCGMNVEIPPRVVVGSSGTEAKAEFLKRIGDARSRGVTGISFGRIGEIPPSMLSWIPQVTI